MKRPVTPGMREGAAGAPRRSSLRRLIQAVELYVHHPYVRARMGEEEPVPRMTWEESQELPLHEVLGRLGDQLHDIADALEEEEG